MVKTRLRAFHDGQAQSPIPTRTVKTETQLRKLGNMGTHGVRLRKCCGTNNGR